VDDLVKKKPKECAKGRTKRKNSANTRLVAGGN